MERVKKESAVACTPAATDASKDEAQRTAADLLDRLPDKLRLPAILYFTCGLKQEEIALELRCSQAVVSARLRSALEKLRLGMQKKGFSALPVSLPVLLVAESIHTAVLSGRCMAELLAVPEKIAAGRKLARSQNTAVRGGKLFVALVVLIVAVVAVATALAVRPTENYSMASPPHEPKAVPYASIPAADDEIKILLSWNFDGEFKEKLEINFLPSMYETVDKKKLDAAATRKSDTTADIVHLPQGGRSGGGLRLNNYRGFVLPIIPPDGPFLISFHIKAQKSESTAAMGIHSHPDGGGFSRMRIFYGYDSDGNLYDPEEKKTPPSIEMPLEKWMKTERLCWFEGKNLMMAGWHENKLLMVCRYYEVASGKDYRIYLGGHQMVLDDLYARMLEKREFDEKYAEIVWFLKSQTRPNAN
jgi:hypothetical protein